MEMKKGNVEEQHETIFCIRRRPEHKQNWSSIFLKHFFWVHKMIIL